MFIIRDQVSDHALTNELVWQALLRHPPDLLNWKVARGEAPRELAELTVEPRRIMRYVCTGRAKSPVYISIREFHCTRSRSNLKAHLVF